ncbi:hypothetical protein SteCoe_33829 [Stentor coeruleus]|uniref:PPM-type phosphatase domain-containing protein n=1 Tax=Stentor coeruleus TaxID=5963 RepID=A0A1R2AVU8_9CILI|nr:hypothetical protein SteCoe_33829 [Stentor coeruleus]
MGNCCEASNKGSLGDRVFYKKVNIKIKSESFTENINFNLTFPENLSLSTFSFDKIDFVVSACSLPGVDPRGIIKKECQDGFFIKDQGESILAGVFDGHGKHGREIVNFCIEFMGNFFNNNFFSDTPIISLSKMVEDCDKALLNESNIDCSTSGTTAAILFLTPTSIWACSVGDSRAILGTLPKYQKHISTEIPDDHSPYRKAIIASTILKSVQITLDQKPNLSYELERIIKSGGKVQQLSNSEGKKIGPHRIWKQNGNIPGLTMSRSIGDSIAKSIGVISKPIIHHMEICYHRDKFIIIASNGVWDAMKNTEAMNFVEKYRKSSSKENNGSKIIVTNNNSTIAEFLCEESRYRWLGICSEEDVAIDDITTIVIEIKPHETNGHPRLKRKGIKTEQIVDVVNNQGCVLKRNKRFDIHRGSAAIIEEDEAEDNEEDE